MVHYIYQGVTGYKFQIKVVFLFVKIVFYEMHNAAFHLGLHCLLKDTFRSY